MSWHFSLALAEEFSQATSSDSEQFALLRSTSTPEAYCWRDKTTESLDLFQSGMMSDPSTHPVGEELLTWFLEGSLAQISASQEPCGGGKESMAAKAVFGRNTCESSTNAGRKKSSQKTLQNLEARGLTKSFDSFPKEGFFADGKLLELPTLDCRTQESDFGFSLPTPTTRDWKDTAGMALTRKDGKTRTDRLPMLLFSIVRSANIKWKQMTVTDARTVNLRGLNILICGKDYHPELPEWLMMWPIGWTDLDPLEMDRYLEWRQSLTKYLNQWSFDK